MIKGNLIKLRLVQEEDLEELHKYDNDMEGRGDFVPISFQTKNRALEIFKRDGMWSEDQGRMIITDLNDSIVGRIVFWRANPHMQGHRIGYYLHNKDDRGKGYAAEALSLFVDFLFKSKDTNRLDVQIMKENTASIKVAEKCGFKYEGTLKQVLFVQGYYRDLMSYSILRDDYFKNENESIP